MHEPTKKTVHNHGWLYAFKQSSQSLLTSWGTQLCIGFQTLIHGRHLQGEIGNCKGLCHPTESNLNKVDTEFCTAVEIIHTSVVWTESMNLTALCWCELLPTFGLQQFWHNICIQSKAPGSIPKHSAKNIKTECLSTQFAHRSSHQLRS